MNRSAGLVSFACTTAVVIATFGGDVSSANQLGSEHQMFATSNLLLRGPIEQVDVNHSRILALGQWFAVPKSQAAASSPGQFVDVYGAVSASGQYVVSALIHIGSVMYVPGATGVVVAGRISSVDKARGTARIGSLTIDYTAALASFSAQKLATGEVVKFGGLQYADPTTLYAVNARIAPRALAVAMGQTGSGAVAMGQTGSGAVAMGQTGSGAVAMGQTGSGRHMMGQTGSGAVALGQTGSGAVAMGQTGSGHSSR